MRKGDQRIDLLSIPVEDQMPIGEMKRVIRDVLLDSGGRLKRCVASRHFIDRNGLSAFLKTLMFRTRFLDREASIVERLFCVWNDISRYGNCQHCGGPVKGFNRGFVDGWYGKFCSRKCNRAVNNPTAFLSDVERDAKNKKIKATVSAQRKAGLPDKWRRKLHIAASRKSVQLKKARTCLDLYGVANPGVLGAYHSKEATRFITMFLDQRGIPQSRARFHDQSSGNSEFFQVVRFGGQRRYVSYDLTVFRTEEAARAGDVSAVELILEYNGPWHWSKNEVDGHEGELSLPYKTSKLTKLESYLFDRAKVGRALDIAQEVIVYWSRMREMQVVGSMEEY